MSELARGGYARLFEHETVTESLVRLRTEDLGQRIFYLYVTDSDGVLKGVVPTRRLLLAASSALIRDVMIGPAISVPETATLGEALETVSQHRLLAVPVVDSRGRLTGVIDASEYSRDMVDVERRETADEFFQLIGVHLEQARISLFSAIKNRLPWLLTNITSGIVAALLAGAFAGVLEVAVALAFFIPVVLAIAESISIQSTVLAIQELHLKRFAGMLHTWGVARHAVVGLVLGLAGGCIVGLIGWLWLGAPQVGAIVFAGMAGGGAAGALIGTLVPRVVHGWKLDPKVASGPTVLAATDVVTLLIYLGVAALVLL